VKGPLFESESESESLPSFTDKHPSTYPLTRSGPRWEQVSHEFTQRLHDTVYQ
jgi:hypothetical protein